MSEVDKAEAIMTVAGGCVLFLNLLAAYRLSVKYNHTRLHAVINWSVVFTIIESLTTALILLCLENTHFYFLDFLAIGGITLCVLLYLLLPVAALGNCIWFAFHYKALLRIRAMRKAKGL